MNKKIIILSVVLLLVIGGAGFFYMDTIIGLFTGEEKKEANLTPQQPQKAPAEQMPPEKVFEKAFEKIFEPSLKSFGLEEFSELTSLKFILKTNIEFTDEFLKELPKPLQKFKNVDLNLGLTADKKNNNFLLAMESVVSKKIQISSFNELANVCFPDLKEIYSASAGEFAKTLPFPIPSFSMNNSKGEPELKNENKDEESGDEESKDEENGEKKVSEEQAKPENQPAEPKTTGNEGSKDKKVIDKIKENFEITREKGEPKNVKIILTPKNKSGNSPESIILFVHKKSFTIEKIEISGKNFKTNQPVSIVSTFEYGESGNINKISTLETEKDAEPKNSSLSLNYNEGLVESLKIEAENANEIINLSYNEEKKFSGINYEKNIEGIGKLTLQISDFAINAEYGENDFIITGTEKYKKKTNEDFNKAVSSGKLAKQVLKINEKDLKLAGEMIFAKIMTAIMSPAKTEIAAVETPESEEDGKPAEEKKSIKESANKQAAEDEGEEQDEEESPKQPPVKKAEPPKKEAKKPEEKKKPEPAAKEESEDEDSEEAEEAPKPAPKKVEKRKSEPVEEKPEPKEVRKPARPAVSDDNLINDMASREYSPKYATIVKQYNSNKIDKVQLLPQIEEVLKSEPNNVEALYMAALINFQNLKNNDEAVKYFDLVLKSANLNSKVERQIYYWSRMLKKQILPQK